LQVIVLKIGVTTGTIDALPYKMSDLANGSDLTARIATA
jgi:hypothetical protein